MVFCLIVGAFTGIVGQGEDQLSTWGYQGKSCTGLLTGITIASSTISVYLERCVIRLLASECGSACVEAVYFVHL